MTALRFILTRIARVVAYLALLGWIIGSGVTFFAPSAELFQRFGALGVAAAVLFFSDRLLKIELSRQRSVERLLHEYGVELQALKSGLAPTEIPKEGFAVDFLTEERNFDKLRSQADMFNLANTILITLATLQWGFGDFFLARLIAHGTA